MTFGLLSTKSEHQARKALFHIRASEPRFTYKEGWYTIYGDFEDERTAHNASMVLNTLMYYEFDMKRIPQIRNFKELNQTGTTNAKGDDGSFNKSFHY